MAEEKSMSKADIMASQASYKGNSHFDLVKVKITKAGDFYKEGDEDIVHPTLAAILKAKGLISNLGEKFTRPEWVLPEGVTEG
jgi:hypothetical protein